MLIGDRGSIASMLPSGRKFWRKQVAGATFAGAFSRDLTARGQPLPPTVSLRELVSGGYIAAADLRAFDGMDVTISLTADEARPREIFDSSSYAGRESGCVAGRWQCPGIAR